MTTTTRANWQRAAADAAWNSIAAIEDVGVQNSYVAIYYELAMASAKSKWHGPPSRAHFAALEELFIKQVMWQAWPPDGTVYAHRSLGCATLARCLPEDAEHDKAAQLAREGILAACDAVGAERAFSGIREWIDLGDGVPQLVETLLRSGVDLFDAFEQARLVGN